MRPYLLVSALIFTAIVVAHGARGVVEGPRLLGEADFLLTTAAAVGMAAWGWVLWWRR